MNFFASIFALPAATLNDWGYWVIGFGAFLESFPLLGTFIPGHLIVIAGGFLAEIDVLNLWGVILISSLAAIGGDLMGYLLGRRYGHAFFSKFGKYLFIKPSFLDKSERVLKTHPTKSLFLGRFNFATRALVPFAAGTVRLKFSKFIFVNIIAGICWAVSSVFIGYVFGASYAVAAKIIGRAVFFGTIIVALIIYTYRFLSTKIHIFKEIDFYIVSLSIGALYLFSRLVDNIIDNDKIVSLDVQINQQMHLIQNSSLTPIVFAVTNLAGPYCITIFALILFGWFFRRKDWRSILLTGTGLLGGFVLELSFKQIVGRIRPTSLVREIGFSFPSGHATMAAVFFALLIILFTNKFKNKLSRYFFVTVNVFLIVGVAFSRLYLQVHWLSDVIGGVALGVFWVTFLLLIFRLAAFLSKKRGREKISVLLKEKIVQS